MVANNHDQQIIYVHGMAAGSAFVEEVWADVDGIRLGLAVGSYWPGPRV